LVVLRPLLWEEAEVEEVELEVRCGAGSRSVSEPDWSSKLFWRRCVCAREVGRAWPLPFVEAEEEVEEEEMEALGSGLTAGDLEARETEEGEGVLRRMLESLSIVCETRR
jgi:hypothetical protein